MTYSPQQPGPSGQYPQQHHFPHPNFPQQGYQQQPWPGPDPQQTSLLYGQSPSPLPLEAGPPFGSPGGRPPRKKVGLLLAVLVAVLVIVGGITTILVLSGDSDPSGVVGQPGQTRGEPAPGGKEPPSGTGEAEMVAVAQSYLDAIAEEDEAAATALTCDGADPGALYAAAAGSQSRLSLGAAEVTGESGSVEIIIGAEEPLPMPMVVQDGSWCIPV